MYNLYIFIILLLLETESFTFGEFNKFLKLQGIQNTNPCAIEETCVYLYKIENDECGQCKLNKRFIKFAKSFTKVNEGNCYSVGYNIPTGNESIIVPVIGPIIINKFKK
jgi:hypothetical protein